MTNTPTPSAIRGQTLREAAAMIRGMTLVGHAVDLADVARFFEEQAEANDILAAGVSACSTSQPPVE